MSGTRARNYNSGIFSDLNLGNLTWSSKFDSTSMMRAIEGSLAAKFKRKEDDKERKKQTDKSCSKCNNCDVVGKCQFEDDNPTK